MPASSLLSVVGIAKETVAGTPVAPTFYIPVHSSPKPVDKQVYLEDKGWRGSFGEDYDFIPGPYHTEYDLDGDVFYDAIGWPLAGVLGDVTTTGTTTTPTGTLSASSIIGATTVSSSVSIPNGTVIQIDVGNLAEIVTTSGAPTGAGPFTIPVPALTKAHASGVAITAITSPYTHNISLLNSGTGQPPSYTITDYNDVSTRQYPGMLFTECSMKFNADGLLTYGAKAVGYPSVVSSKPTPSYSAERPISGLTGTVQIGGSPTTIMISGECTIKRSEAIIQSIDGTVAPRNIWGGMVSVDGKMTLVMEDEVQLLNYLNNSQPSLDLNYAFGSGATARQFRLHLSSAAYTAATVERGKDFVELSVTYKSRFNSSDAGYSGGYSPIKATVQNLLPSGTYK
ncbi:hypothetical protein D5S17_32775 [Pseudonocardiaceae bacterium YIM PH 21723]|nr:hypothetical protein D5S17_32775 [Pseudonocardiaceae bacterium YIM PH 21723]